LVTELVRRPVDVIVVGGSTPGVLAAEAASATIPIVFSVASDPVASKIVTTLNRPDGNATGVTNYNQVLPRAINIAVVINPLNAVFAPQSKDLEDAARTLWLRVQFLSVKTENDLAPAFTNLTKQGSGALLVTDDPFFNSQQEQLVALAMRRAVATIYTYREFAIADDLMSYAANLSDMYRQLGTYTAKVLEGEKPSNLQRGVKQPQITKSAPRSRT
jgi:putative ABC transport system substrate-binding protein